MEIISFVPFIVLIMANNTQITQQEKRETTMEKIYGTKAYWKAVFRRERRQKIKSTVWKTFIIITLTAITLLPIQTYAQTTRKPYTRKTESYTVLYRVETKPTRETACYNRNR